MNKKHIIYTIIMGLLFPFFQLFISNSLSAQELTVKSFVARTNDLTAITQPRVDNNGVPCALVKVQLAAPRATFEGNVIGRTEEKTSEYWVYLASGSKRIKVSVQGYLPLEINFSDYQISYLESKVTYILIISSNTTEKKNEDSPIPVTPQLTSESSLHNYLTLNYGTTRVNQSVGCTYGHIGEHRWGWYVSAMTGLAFDGYYAAGSTKLTGTIPFFGGEETFTRLSALGGFVYRPSTALSFFGGVGYGENYCYWKTLDHEWFLIEEVSYQGFDVALGFQLSLGHLLLSTEVVSTNFSTLEGKVGLGFWWK